MASTNQPLLYTSKTSKSHKVLYVFLSLFAILSSSATIVTLLIRGSPFSINNKSSIQLPNICEHAYNKSSCMTIVNGTTPSPKIKMTHVGLLQDLLKKSIADIEHSIKKTDHVRNYHVVNNGSDDLALVDCIELMELSVDRIKDSIVAIDSNSNSNDAHTWISSVLTNHVTCLDGLNGPSKLNMEQQIKDLIVKARTSLAILVSISPKKEKNMISSIVYDLPKWVAGKDRKLLQLVAKDMNADVVVAKDGSGKYTTIAEAVNSAPDNGKTRYVIYVKKGVYKENVEVGKKKKNIMIVGDGMDSTIITGSLNVVDGSTTFKSATLAAVGDGFIAQDIWIQNTAGPEKHQAVALRVGADQSVINRCRIDAYQDTLYAHSNRQFYRDSYITGTVDFIFGDASVVIQKCKIVARKPMMSQSNMVTAQGRVDPNQNTGTSIQNCEVTSSSDLDAIKSSIKSYLGRPWKEYSRTVFMQSYIGDHIDASGWSIWDGEFGLKTLYYGEYINRGPGATTSKRVKWPGYHVITSASEAQKFTVAQLIQGGSWLKPTGIPFIEGL